MPSIVCPACGGEMTERFLDRPHHALSVFWPHADAIPDVHGRFDRCPACGHVFLVSATTDPAYAAAAATLYQGYELLQREARPFPQRDAHYAGAVDYLRDRLNFSGQGNVLEIGSNRGDFLYLLREAAPGYAVLGLEPSVLPFYGVPTVGGFFGQVRLGGRFDLIVSRHMLEHVTDPLAVLRGVTALLADTGQVFLEVPNMHYDMAHTVECFIPEHIHHFCERSLAVLLERAGLVITDSDRSRPEGLRLLAKPGRPDSLERFVRLDAADMLRFREAMEHTVQQFLAWIDQGRRPVFYGFGNIFLDVLAECCRHRPLEHLLAAGALLVDDTPAKIGRTFRGLPIVAPAEGLAAGDLAVMVCTMNPSHRRAMVERVRALAGARARIRIPWEVAHAA